MGRWSRRDVLAALGAAGAVGGAPTLTEATASGGDWRMFGHDAGNTGFAPGTTGPDTRGEEVWQFRDPAGAVDDETAWLPHPPSVVGDVAYLTSARGTVEKVATADGSLHWSVETANSVTTQPAVVGGRVVVGVNGGGLVALDAESGDVLWRFRQDTVLEHPAVNDGTVYTVGSDGVAYAVDADTAHLQWSVEVGDNVSPPAVGAGGVYVGTVADEVHAFDATTGERRWRTDVASDANSAPVVAGDVVLASSLRELHALDVETGESRWSWRTDRGVGVPAVADGTVYVGRLDERVYALDLATGEREWSEPVGGQIEAPPAVVDGTLYVQSVYEDAYALDAATGDVRWVRGGSGWAGAPVVTDGTLYLVDQASVLHAYRDGDAMLDVAESPTDETATDPTGESEPNIADGRGPTEWLDGWYTVLGVLLGAPLLGPLVLGVLLALSERTGDDADADDD